MERISCVYDCNNNLIFFYRCVLDDKTNVINLSNEQYAKAVKTISAPAIIIELNNRRTRYYYRAICWDKTLMIGVSFINGIWEVIEYLENPSGAFVLAVLKKNLVEGSAVLHFQTKLEDNALEYPLR
ncbi:hypothetical protein [Niastella populi]|uniref:Uncharacterized protein n=1 Tax=Niastella populi TaxID=550983 RepID=A0A1V9EFT0_9BACT|nr:hypothetical protein [Niastella populi]OQP44911.1 hypothetical protein A4R26_32465 [Niastella populi]